MNKIAYKVNAVLMITPVDKGNVTRKILIPDRLALKYKANVK